MNLVKKEKDGLLILMLLMVVIILGLSGFFDIFIK
jgi:hypothetical protein